MTAGWITACHIEYGVADEIDISNERQMKKLLIVLLLTGFIDVATASDDFVFRPRAVQEFAELPAGVRLPEGITANPANGDIFVSTFDFGGNNKLLRYDRHGKLVAAKDFGATPLLGLEFNPVDQNIYLANLGASQIQRIAAVFTAQSAVEVVANVPSIGAAPSRDSDNPDGSKDTTTFGSNGFPGPNGLVFNAGGSLFVSDSFQGAIFRIDNPQTCAPSCQVSTVKQDGLLATAGFPAFGANGLALNADGNTLFIANTGDDRVLSLDLTSGALAVLAESIDGADGLAMHEGRLVVVANQADEIAILNGAGRVVAGLGEFRGIKKDGSPRGLLFPASIVIVDGWAYVTNLALTLTPNVGDEPEEDVTKYTVSRIRLPKFDD